MRWRRPSRRTTILLAGAVALFACGACSTPGTYTAKRLDDLTDVLHVDLFGAGVGALVRVGPVLAGWESIGDITDGHGPAGSGRTSIGLGGVRESRNSGTAFGLLYPFSDFESRRTTTRYSAPEEDPPGFVGHYRPNGFGAVGAEVELLVGIGVYFDFVELADFLTGFVGWDIIDDDDQLYVP